MNLDIFKSPDPSGRLSREKYLMTHFPKEYDFVIEYCRENSIGTDVPFREKVYLSINGLISVSFCKNPNCQNLVRFKNSSVGYLDYCSNKCISSDPNIKKIKEEKSFEKYGTKAPAQSEEIKNKMIETNNRKYGGNSPISSEEIRNKSKETIMSKYGVDNVSKVVKFKEKRVESFKKNIEQYKESYKKTSIHKYGVPHPWMNSVVHKKTIDVFYQNYRDRINSLVVRKNVEFIEFKKDISTKLVFKCGSCQSEFEILTYQFYYRSHNLQSICTKCFPISQSSSISQIDVYNFLRENYESNIEMDVKGVISPYEIDIYLSDEKIGFEYNGVFWHSSKFKDPSYHLSKLKTSRENNLGLYTIWEDDWVTKNDICKSFILNKIGKTPNKIYARNCEVREVRYLDSKKFLDENHLQGDVKSPIRIGLFYRESLVSLMTFGSLRAPFSQGKKKGVYELSRFCNLNYHIIVGGASKLLNFFVKRYNPDKIETYSDNLISDGKLYQQLGFKYVHTSSPGYWYNIEGIRSHRYNWRKNKLVEMGYDSSKTEEEIMNELGYHRIYNAGNKKWELIYS